MMKKVLGLAIVIIILLGTMCTLVGCGKKEKQKIVYASIVAGNETNSQALNTKLFQTYEQIINSRAIKSVIEDKYGSVGDIELEYVEDTQMIKVIYVCDDHTDDECINLVNDWIAEFTRRIKELYNVDNTHIIDEPKITTRMIKK